MIRVVQITVIVALIILAARSVNNRMATYATRTDWLMGRTFDEVRSALGEPDTRCETPAQFSPVRDKIAREARLKSRRLPLPDGVVWVYKTSNPPMPNGHLIVYFDKRERVMQVTEVAR